MAEAAPSTTEGTAPVSIVAEIAKTEVPVETKVETAPATVEDKKIDETKPEEKPIEYVDFKLPEGFEPDAEVLTEFKTAAKELKLTQEQAQKLVDMQTKMVAKASKVTEDQWATVQKDWRTKAESDAEFGGKDFKANVGVAKKALDQFGSKEFKEAIEITGMGNHPELIRFLYKVGKAISEDKIMTGGNSATGPRDLAKILFPNQN